MNRLREKTRSETRESEGAVDDPRRWVSTLDDESSRPEPSATDGMSKAINAAMSGHGENPELAGLFDQFSQIAEELVHSHDLLRGQVASLEAELAAKDIRLERKKRLEALGRVAAGVAHEFRNPLGGIRLTVDALRPGAATPASVRRLNHIEQAVVHLNRIVEDLLTFTGSSSLERGPLDWSEVLGRTLNLVYPEQASPDNLQTVGPESFVVLGDRHALIQVLVNLITNARQMQANDELEMGVFWGETEERAWIEVADQGPGISPEEEEVIFHPFHSRRDGGTGLGLAIVHSRIEALEGEISLVRDAWGPHPEWTGARFRILLPKYNYTKESR